MIYYKLEGIDQDNDGIGYADIWRRSCTISNPKTAITERSTRLRQPFNNLILIPHPSTCGVSAGAGRLRDLVAATSVAGHLAN